MDYRECVERLASRNGVTVARNTKIYLDPRTQRIHVSLHGNCIVVMEKNGAVRLDTCGYPTTTTRNRMNLFMPDNWSVVQDNHFWFLTYGDHHVYPFFNRVQIVPDETGSIRNVVYRLTTIPEMVEWVSGWGR